MKWIFEMSEEDVKLLKEGIAPEGILAKVIKGRPLEEKDKTIADLESYAEQVHHEELLSETGQWIANRIVLECIKIVKKEKEKTDADSN